MPSIIAVSGSVRGLNLSGGLSVVNNVGGAPCCCGEGCGCFDNVQCYAGFSYTSGFANSGIYHNSVNGGPTHTRLTGQFVTCCCPRTPELIAGKKLRYVYQRSVTIVQNGSGGGVTPCPPGTLIFFQEIRHDVDGTTARARSRTSQRANSAVCYLVHESADDTYQIPGGARCVGASVSPPTEWPGFQIFANGQQNPDPTSLAPPPTDAFDVSGYWDQGCTFNRGELRFKRGFANGEILAVSESVTAYLFPNSEVCSGKPCFYGCCLPGSLGGYCRDVGSAQQCLNLGGIPKESCFEANCEGTGPGRGRCCNPITGGCFVVLPEECLEPNIFAGIGTLCATGSEPNCPQPIGACCLPSQPGGQSCAAMTPQQCAAANGSWLGAGSSCVPNPCPGAQPGACCRPDGGCDQNVTAEDCLNIGGIWRGAGSDCNLIFCVGACCQGGASPRCDPYTQQHCISIGGVWLGTTIANCAPDPCVLGACCCGGVCTQKTQLDCEGPFGGSGCQFQGQGSSCSPNPCAFGRPMYAPGTFGKTIVLPDGTPVGTRPSSRLIIPGKPGGCGSCGGAKGEIV